MLHGCCMAPAACTPCWHELVVSISLNSNAMASGVCAPASGCSLLVLELCNLAALCCRCLPMLEASCYLYCARDSAKVVDLCCVSGKRQLQYLFPRVHGSWTCNVISLASRHDIQELAELLDVSCATCNLYAPRRRKAPTGGSECHHQPSSTPMYVQLFALSLKGGGWRM
jgi:hypothetical protein